MAQAKRKTAKKTSQVKKTPKRTSTRTQSKFAVTVDNNGVIKAIKPMK